MPRRWLDRIMPETLYHGTTGKTGRQIAKEGKLRQVGHRDKYALSRKGRVYACRSYDEALEFAQSRTDEADEDDMAVVEFVPEGGSVEIDEDTYASFLMLSSEREAKALYADRGPYRDAGTAIWNAIEAARKKLEELGHKPQGHPTDPTHDWKKQLEALHGTPELAELTRVSQCVSVSGSPKIVHVWLIDPLSDEREELPLGETVGDPITPIEEMGFADFVEYVDSQLFYVRVDCSLDGIEKFRANRLALYATREGADSAGRGTTMCIECTDLDTRSLFPAGGHETWQRSFLADGVCGYSGLVKPGDMFAPVEEDESSDTEMLQEGKRAQQASSLRLRRIVHDALSRSRTFRQFSKKVQIKGDEMTVKVGRKKYQFGIKRDENGWVKEAVPVTGHGPKMKGVKKAVAESFRRAHFQQILEDASSGLIPRLVMLDYVRLNGGRRTRLIEAYSYRYKPSKNRSYLYGWNVEEGGIRSYIVDRIKGARITEMKFDPRFMIEIGKNDTQKGPAIIDMSLKPVVSDAMVRRGHQRFELAGGRGKIIRRLGHSVERSKKRASI